MERGALTKAVRAWRAVLDHDRVVIGEAASRRYGRSTLEEGVRTVPAALLLRTLDEVVAVVKTATAHRIPLYPISQGHNWGYGSAAAPRDGSIVLDLSGMKGISAPDADLGIVTIEPGVTTGELERFLAERSMPFLSPHTGAGPTSSVLGNLLERGLSSSPPADRFASLIALEAVLPDGDVYRSPLAEGKRGFSSAVYRWGIGPYLDGLFAQSNVGVVTKVTIALAKRPDHHEMFFVVARERNSVGELAAASREVLQRNVGLVSALKIQGPSRTFARLERYPENAGREVLDPERVRAYLKACGLSNWLVFGSLQGSRPVVRAARRGIRALYRPHASRISFFSERDTALYRSLRPSLPRFIRTKFAFMPMVDSFLHSAMGRQGLANPKLPLWRRTRDIPLSKMDHFLLEQIDYDTDPACGFLIFAATVPMRKRNVDAFLAAAHEVLARHRIEPFISMSALSDRVLFASCQILFDKRSRDETARAHRCYEELFHCTNAAGARLQRSTAKHMHLLSEDIGFWRLARTIKNALDPAGIISPGRYIPSLTLRKKKREIRKKKRA